MTEKITKEMIDLHIKTRPDYSKIDPKNTLSKNDLCPACKGALTQYWYWSAKFDKLLTYLSCGKSDCKDKKKYFDADCVARLK